MFPSSSRRLKPSAYDIQSDGALAKKRLHCQIASDGVTLDTEGNLYLTGEGEIVLDKTGKRIAHIDVPEHWTANVSFGSKDHKTLFITARIGFYPIRMQNRDTNAVK